MNVEVTGDLPAGVTAKDIALGIISEIGTDGGTGHVIEYSGKAIRSLSMDGRMTLCNMSIESGARAGMIAPDDVTFAYIERRPYAPKGADWNAALDQWSQLRTDESAQFDRRVSIAADHLAPFVTWGTSPGMVTPITGRVPDPDHAGSAAQSNAWKRALGYMGLKPDTAIEDIAVDRIFIGSCTNARIEDLREAAAVLRGYRVHPRVKGIVVPGSYEVKRTAEAEGLDRVFLDAGLEWREPGCSMCLGMNPDIVPAGERCASTSNRNFEGRQGRDARTHLVSPAMAAAAAVYGHFTDVRSWTLKG
jgi:3-isopropylmalate/(R)-2-methylmalate dehydratase large subunit